MVFVLRCLKLRGPTTGFMHCSRQDEKCGEGQLQKDAGIGPYTHIQVQRWPF